MINLRVLYLVIDLRVLHLMLIYNWPVKTTIYLQKLDIKSFISLEPTSSIVIGGKASLLDSIINKNEWRAMVV